MFPVGHCPIHWILSGLGGLMFTAVCGECEWEERHREFLACRGYLLCSESVYTRTICLEPCNAWNGAAWAESIM